MKQETFKRYAALGIDVTEALSVLTSIPLSIHCWQGDDVRGFHSQDFLSGGIQTTGNYLGRARNFDELTQDLELALSLMPGTKRVNLHALYAISDENPPMDALTIAHFEPWIAWAQKHHLSLDFNPTLFSHPMVKDGLTLSSPDENVRRFWIKHVKACRAIALEMGKRQGNPCLCNLWIPDGLKDIPADRLGPRLRLKQSLDEIYATQYPKEYVLDSVESKVFGIGVESYTVGSSEFYMNYAALHGLCCLLDSGHYHPTESVADKIPSLLSFYDHVALHLTRSVRWDSDHVVRSEDSLRDICSEIVRCHATDKVSIGLDYFDASINRIAAWVIGQRSVQKNLLKALLTPWDTLKKMQDDGDFTHLMEFSERLESLPFGDVWEAYLESQGLDEAFMRKIDHYEQEVLVGRKSSWKF